jgi:peptidoglycan/xylan/chitin deacetylase (PgdA/CDA1 family)
VNSTQLRLDRSGRPAFPYFQRRRTRNAQILIYHRVNDDRDPYFGGIPTIEFDRQMAYVSSRFRVLPLSALVTALRAGELPDNAIAVTLDDGYRDNYLRAYPILRQYSIPATIFLTTSVIGSDRQLWHDDVFSAFRMTTAPTLEPFASGSVGGPLTTVGDRLRVQHEFLAHIRTLDAGERTAAIARLRDQLRVGPPPKTPGLMLTWDEIRTMSRGGIQFGSHTVTHPILSRIDRVQAMRELTDSKNTIEEQLGLPVEGFAYPNGTRTDFLPDTKSLLREAGYTYAVTTIPGANESGVDLFELHRGTPWDEDIFAFGVRLLYNKLRS